MNATPPSRSTGHFALFSAGFRPLFLASAIWAALAIPLWLCLYAGWLKLPNAMPLAVWHVHEMVFGFGSATVAGFLLTAVPNWTGRLPLQGKPLAALTLLWAAGRAAMLGSAVVGAAATTAMDLAFPLVFLLAISREVFAGRSWRNLPMVIALALLLIGNALVHVEALSSVPTSRLGNRIGIATLLMLISIVGGRIIPSFTRNWLVKEMPGYPTPAPFARLDVAALLITAIGLAIWALAPGSVEAPWAELAAGASVLYRLARWKGLATLREPLLWILHLGYAWVGFGLLLLALNSFTLILPETTALHALTVGAIGTMTLAVMTRATLGHTGRPLTAGSGTVAIYLLVTLAALLRLAAPISQSLYLPVLSFAGLAWTGAFGLFALLYGRALLYQQVRGEASRPI